MPFDMSELSSSGKLNMYQDFIGLRHKSESSEAIARHREHLRETNRSTKDEFLGKIWGNDRTEPTQASDEYRQIVEMLEDLEEYMDEPISEINLKAMRDNMQQKYSAAMYLCDQYLKSHSGYRFTKTGKQRKALVETLRRQLEDEALMLQNGLEELQLRDFSGDATLRSMLTGTRSLDSTPARAREFSLPVSEEEQRDAEEDARREAEQAAKAARDAEAAAGDKAAPPAKEGAAPVAEGDEEQAKQVGQQVSQAEKKVQQGAAQLSKKKYTVKKTGKAGAAAAAAIAAAKAAAEAAEKAAEAARVAAEPTKAAAVAAEAAMAAEQEEAEEEEQEAEAEAAGGQAPQQEEPKPREEPKPQEQPKQQEQPKPQEPPKPQEQQQPGEGTLADLRRWRRRLVEDRSLDADKSATIQILLMQIDRAVTHGEQSLCADLIDQVVQLCSAEEEGSNLKLAANACRVFKEKNGLQGSSEDEDYAGGLTFSDQALADNGQVNDIFPEYRHLSQAVAAAMLAQALEETGGNVSGPSETIGFKQDVLNDTNRMLRMQYRMRANQGQQPGDTGAPQEAPKPEEQPAPQQAPKEQEAKAVAAAIEQLQQQPAPAPKPQADDAAVEQQQQQPPQQEASGQKEKDEEQALKELEEIAEKELAVEAAAKVAKEAAQKAAEQQVQPGKESGPIAWIRRKMSGLFRRKKSEPDTSAQQVLDEVDLLLAEIRESERQEALEEQAQKAAQQPEVVQPQAEAQQPQPQAEAQQAASQNQAERRTTPFRYTDEEYRKAMVTANLMEQVANKTRLPAKTRLHRVVSGSYLSTALGIPVGGDGSVPKGAARKINMQAGKIVLEPGFMRTTYAAAPATAKQPVMLTLLCDEGTPVVSAGKGEMLLGRGVSYMILGAVTHRAGNALQLPAVERAAKKGEKPMRAASFQGIEIFAKVSGQTMPENNAWANQAAAATQAWPQRQPQPPQAPKAVQPKPPQAPKAQPQQQASKAPAAPQKPLPQVPKAVQPKPPQVPKAVQPKQPQASKAPQVPQTKPSQTPHTPKLTQKQKNMMLALFHGMLKAQADYDKGEDPGDQKREEYEKAFRSIKTMADRMKPSKTSNSIFELPVAMDTFRGASDDFLAGILGQADDQLPDDAKGQSLVNGKVNHAWLADAENRDKLKGKKFSRDSVLCTMPSRRQALLMAQQSEQGGGQAPGKPKGKQQAPGKGQAAAPGGTHLLKIHLPEGQLSYLYTDPSKPVYGLYLPRENMLRIDEIKLLADGQHEIHLTSLGG